ncbi:MAG: hypothetical protein methR_P0367 [Methyloprofundus sp.]|nr:MAG: hypothetical protein methR_P0367 [Methyloprofundus sp.]
MFGDWGIGKLSIIEQLRQNLKEVEHCDYVVGEFNAWSYEHTPNSQAGIAHEMISALTTIPRQGKRSWRGDWNDFWKIFWNKLCITWKFATNFHGKKILVILLIVWVGLVCALPILETNPSLEIPVLFGFVYLLYKGLKTIMSQPLAAELKTYLQLPSYQKHLGTVPEMSKNIKGLCEICLGKNIGGKNRRMIFFVDDLDRCGVDGIVKTFEAIRLVLDIPWATVVIAMDQRIILPALASHYESLSKYHSCDPIEIARDYLAKVIHLPVSLQVPDDSSVAKYLASIWNDPEFEASINKVQPKVQPVKADCLKQKEKLNLVDGEKSTELLRDIIADIDSLDIQSMLRPLEKEEQPVEDPSENTGFGQEQKIKFYEWLIKFNLRNPRQIKRLYNNYNLLWSIYAGEWNKDDNAWYIHMLALLALEMVSEHVPFDKTSNIRKEYREAFFAFKGNKQIPDITGVEAENINEAYKLIFDYQASREIDLLKRVEPFVLPEITL